VSGILAEEEIVVTSTGACLDPDAVIEFVEGRASPALREMVEHHAASCTACRKLLSSLARERASTAPQHAAGDTPPPAGHTRQPLSPAPGKTIGRYIVRGLLGTGGMGSVYVAHDPELGREVAVKLLAPALGDSEACALFEARFRREARALARVAHPNVVAVHDFGTVDDRMFITMELIEGQTVADWCKAERPAARAILDVFVAAGRGLAAAHAAGVVHRDVKPENMMLGKDGRVRVVDFGLARADVDFTLTVAGAVMGTPRYMAPEQHRGEEADERTDQFSFCVALYIALFGESPFRGDDLDSLARSVTTGEPREPPPRRGVPRRIWRALRRGMSAAREDRFPRLDDLLAEIAPARATGWVWRATAIGLCTAVVGAITAVVIAAPSSGARTIPADAGPSAIAAPAHPVPATPPPPADAATSVAVPVDAAATPPTPPSHHVHLRKPVHHVDPPFDRGD
jgi:serine/threonine protein kinase